MWIQTFAENGIAQLRMAHEYAQNVRLKNTSLPQRISRNSNFHKLIFGGGMAEKRRECQLVILTFLYLAEGVFENVLPNSKVVI